MQRVVSPSIFDRCLGCRLGVQEMERTEPGLFGQVVCQKGRCVTSAPIETEICRLNLIDPVGETVRQVEALRLMLGC